MHAAECSNTNHPVAAFKDAYKSSTENSKSGSFVGKEFAKAEGAVEGASAALSVVNMQMGSNRSNSTQNHATSEARTSTLMAGKDLTILATDGSITSQGAQISAEGNALILAKDNIKLDVAHNTESRSQDSKKSGFSIDTRSVQVVGTLNNNGKGNGDTDTVTGTKLSVGGSTTMATQTGDIALTGANVVSEGNLSINAARDLTIASAQDTLHNANQSNNKAIGKVVVSDTERFSGYHNEKHKDNSDQVTQVASNVSSLKGDVNLTAGQKYTQASSNVLAGNDVNITAKTIDITALQNTGSHQESNSDLKIGAFARISSPLIDLANNVEAARKSDGRLKAMQGMAATANAYQAASAINSMTGGAGSGVLVKGEAGIGFASSSNSSNSNDSTAQGSTINGGRNVTLTATGGDIHATGASLNAGKTLSLDAAQNIVLDASQSTLHSDGKNKSSGVEAGVGFQVGAQTGMYVYASANMGKGHNNNDSTVNNNTELKADTINIHSKGDTTLKGATATANTINTDVGGKLAVESLQDTSEFDSKQTNVGARVQVGFGVWSANGNVSQQNGKGSYAGVGQQSGLFAGDGGYHVKADTIDLKGGAIASTNAAASELATNKLTTSNIENKMKYSASNVSMAGGTGGNSELLKDDAGKILPLSQQNQAFGTAKDGNVAPGLPMVDKGSDSSTTYATVTDGKITIGGVTTNSVKDLGINTDASKANTALDKLPDLQKLLKDQQAMSAAAGTVIATTKQIAGDIALGAAKAEKAAEATLKDPKSTDEQKLAATKASEEARQTLKDWGTGGVYSRALNAGVGILTGVMAGQGGGQITANAIAPTVAKIVGDIGSDLETEATKKAFLLTELAQQAKDRGDSVAAAELTVQANEAASTAAKWGDNGAYRVGLHAATQGMLGGLANGQAAAFESAAGVIGGNLGQQLAAQLGTAEADNLGLKGQEKAAFVNAFQQTGAVIGGMLAGAAAGNATGNNVDVGSVLAAAQGGQAAGVVDTYNRQLHVTEVKLLAAKARQLAASSAQKTEDQQKLEQAWNTMLTLAANVEVDANAKKDLDAYLGKLTLAAQQTGNYGPLETFVANFNKAQLYVRELSGQTIVGTTGVPVIAYGSPLKTFQSSDAHYNDSLLLASGPLGLEDTAKALGPGNTLLTLDLIESRNARLAVNPLIQRMEDRTLQDIAKNGAATSICPDCNLIGAGGLAKSFVGLLRNGAGREAIAVEGAAIRNSRTVEVNKEGVASGNLFGSKGMGVTVQGNSAARYEGVGSAVDNIYSNMRPLADDFPELVGVNPHYVENAAAGVNTNCISCVNAAQKRLTGQSAEAVAEKTKYGNRNDLLPSAPFGFGSTTTPSAVIEEMLAAGNGAARPLIIEQPGAVQHVINVVNRNGKIYFIDSQMEKIVTLRPNLPVILGNP